MSYERRRTTHTVRIDSCGPDIFVVCGDMRGFRLWTRKVGHASRSFKLLMEPCVRVWRTLQDKGYFFKMNGDGFIVTKKMVRGHNCGLAMSVLEDAYRVWESTNNLIINHHHPRPGGFRVRVGVGESAILYHPEGIDFLADIVNTVSKDYMQTDPHIPVLADEGTVELIGPDKRGNLVLTKREDGLYIVQINELSN